MASTTNHKLVEVEVLNAQNNALEHCGSSGPYDGYDKDGQIKGRSSTLDRPQIFSALSRYTRRCSTKPTVSQEPKHFGH